MRSEHSRKPEKTRDNTEEAEKREDSGGIENKAGKKEERDTATVVRCRCCRYLRNTAEPGEVIHFCGNLEMGCQEIPLSMGLDFYCALGELRE